MNKNDRLPLLLNQWFATRQKMREWVLATPSNPGDTERAAYRALQDFGYEQEWQLLELGASRAAWEKALDSESNLDRQDALDIREGEVDLDWLPAAASQAASGAKVSGWWFLPYAVWTGAGPFEPAAVLPQPLEAWWATITSRAHSAVAGRWEEALESANADRADPLRVTFQTVPLMDVDRLRGFAFPPGPYAQWPATSQWEVSLEPPSPKGLRAGCIGVQVTADSYLTLARTRDLLREEVFREMDAAADASRLRFGMLMPRGPALEEAELLRWFLWAEDVLSRPLDPAATARHVSFTTVRESGQPVYLEGIVEEMDGEMPFHQGSCLFRVQRAEDLSKALLPFLANDRPDLTWSMHQAVGEYGSYQ